MFRTASLISSYSRAQALEDGVLVDVTGMAHEAGFVYPVAVTSRVWSGVVEPSEASRADGQSEEGRLWDVLWMARTAVRGAPAGADRLSFGVLVLKERGELELARLESVCGPGDRGEPVVTIQYRDED